ncbi:hypothetical protein BD289DRAFT_480540 [Coniella lustricola]|uniref:Apple domain-containing protein n=1 Tax=Coniella lustricola TaxID=2025994 RepID=A0A2T3AF30_9PEZI|nr:hypothetical protein BD289DRAFT_480540 [Coniella lustricola]
MAPAASRKGDLDSAALAQAASSEKEAFDFNGSSGLQVVEESSAPEVVVSAADVYYPYGGEQHQQPPSIHHSSSFSTINSSAPAYQQYHQQQQQQQQLQEQQHQHNPYINIPASTAATAAAAYQHHPSPPPPPPHDPKIGYKYNNGRYPLDTDAYIGRSGNGPSKGAANTKDRICKLPRKVFWVLFAVIVFALLAAIAHNNNPKFVLKLHDQHLINIRNYISRHIHNYVSRHIHYPPNLTLYTLSTSVTKKYLVLCGRDYNSDGGTADLTQFNLTTFESCLSQCGTYDGCTAVGWGNYQGTYTCWLKSNIGTPNQSPGWYSAIEYD